MALTKRIVEAQGGRVGVSSRPGEGSTFFAVLPRVPLAASARDCVSRILVIADQNRERFLLTQRLQSNGYLVDVASTCAEAFEKCRRGRFEAIILDLVLPDGPGWDALMRIPSLEHHRNTSVIVISGFERADLEIPLNMKSFLTKPIHPDHLLGELKRLGAPMGALNGSQ